LRALQRPKRFSAAKVTYAAASRAAEASALSAAVASVAQAAVRVVASVAEIPENRVEASVAEAGVAVVGE
jgi:hypothetical protein